MANRGLLHLYFVFEDTSEVFEHVEEEGEGETTPTLVPPTGEEGGEDGETVVELPPGWEERRVSEEGEVCLLHAP